MSLFHSSKCTYSQKQSSATSLEELPSQYPHIDSRMKSKTAAPGHIPESQTFEKAEKFSNGEESEL